MSMKTEEQKLKEKECNKKYYQDHKDEIKERHKKWENDNREKINTNHKLWVKNNLEHSKELQQKADEKYKILHPDAKKISAKKRRKEHPEDVKASVNKWRQNNPDKVKLMYKKHSHKRNRNLGFEPLNNHFLGSHGHHINKTQIIYISEELHKMHPHDLNKPKTMIEINRLAFEYLTNDIKQI